MSIAKYKAFAPDENGADAAFYNDEWHFGEWVYGYYVCLNEKEHRIYTGYAETDCGDYYPDFYTVAPETVCMLAFETTEDMGETTFYEGDIVEVDRGETKWLVTIEDAKRIPREFFGSSVVSRKVVETKLTCCHCTFLYKSL